MRALTSELEEALLRKRLLQRMDPLAASGRRESKQAGLYAFGPQLFSYCAFTVERLAPVRLPHSAIGIVLSGNKEVWLGDAVRRLQPGDVFVVPGNLDFDVVNIPDERRGLYESLLLEVSVLPAPLAGVRAARSGAASGEFEISVPLTADLVDALGHAAITLADTGYAKELADHRLAEVLLLLRDVPAARPLFACSLADQVSWLVMGAPSRDWTAAEIGRELGIGASTLRRRLGTEGRSLRQIMADCRMRLARDLLAGGHQQCRPGGRGGGLRLALAFRPALPPRLRRAAGPYAQRLTQRPAQPRPSNGIVVALMVMNSTLASSGRLAM